MIHAVANAPRVFRSPEGEARFMQAYDAVVKDWPVAYQELDLPTRFGRTHVIASGRPDASALVLLPSLAATATLWYPNVATLSRHYRVYAVDVIGQVGKSIPTRRMRTRRNFADWVADLLDALHVQRASIVGSSYGGFLAMNQASLTPDRVERLVLISPAGVFVGSSWWFYYAMLIKGPILKLLRRKRAVTRLPGGMRLDPSGWGALMSVTMSVSARPNTVWPVVFSKTELKAIRTPTLLLIGAQERLYEALPTLKRALQRMPGLSGAIVPNAGHLAAMTHPDEVNERIIQFLGRSAAATTASGTRL
jgi:pimeloyl-ACP methyl ester carboxylesterase